MRGQNKNRPPPFQRNLQEQLCHQLSDVAENEESKTCNNEKCRCQHNVKEYLTTKPKDIGNINI